MSQNCKRKYKSILIENDIVYNREKLENRKGVYIRYKDKEREK